MKKAMCFKCVVLICFHLQTDCDLQPCKHGGRCVAKYEENDYSCVCSACGKERHCETPATGNLYTNFVEERSRYLKVSPTSVASVYCALECSQLCLPNSSCFSFNLASSSDEAGKRDCQLLSTDKFNSYLHLEANQEYDHYSMKVRRSESKL